MEFFPFSRSFVCVRQVCCKDVLKDWDDPDVILHPLPPGPKSMVCRDVSVATLTSLLKSQDGLHGVDYYVFKFVADDVDSK